MKTCFKCGVQKPLSEFYKHSDMADGHLNKCKDCTKSDVSSNYADNRKQYSDYEKSRFQRPERKAYAAKAQQKHRALNPEKYKARTAVSNALRSGKLKREPCVMCGNVKSQAHHEDYSKPLEVEWLCFECHREWAHGQVTV